MPEHTAVSQTTTPWTVPTLTDALHSIGVRPGMTLLVQMAMSKLGWVVGGPVAVIQALLAALGHPSGDCAEWNRPSDSVLQGDSDRPGTLMMATHCGDNSDPAQWQNPPVPEAWWQTIRDNMPAYDPRLTPTRGMGAVPELFRSWPGVLRSAHPGFSMAAYGPQAAYLTADHDLEDDIGERSPIGKLYELDGHVLLLGVGHGNDTSLHLAEHRAGYPGKGYITGGSAMLVDGVRQWVTYRSPDLYVDDFEQIGAAFEAAEGVPVQQIGNATVRFFRQRALVDFATQWMLENRVSSTPQEGDQR